MHQKEAVNVGQIASGIGRGAMRFGKTLGGVPGDLGNVALTAGRRGLNALGSMGGVQGVGNATIGAAQKAVGNMAGVGRMSKFNPLNMGAGAGILGSGAMALKKMFGGAGAPAGAPAGASAGTGSAGAAGLAGGLGNFSQRAQQMWANLPVEARYAIGAGVPLALLGGLTGRKGLGALGLGAAALGGAAGGAFGDDARRFIGRGMYNIGSFFGGKGDHASQLDMLSKLSPGLGATVLMGRDKNLSSADAQKQYEFLTKNKDIIAKMLPQLTGKSASALVGTVLLGEEEKAARCWKGYEPVPGKAPYSNDSCRPVGSKKKKPAEKKSAEECCDSASVPAHAADEKTKQVKPKPAVVTNSKKVVTGDLGQKKAESASAGQSHFSHPEKELEPVVNNKKPSQEGIKHHKVNSKLPSSGETLSPSGALLQPDMKPTSD